jgi:hypothetical protein
MLLDEVESTAIDWKEGKNYIKKIVKKTKKNTSKKITLTL